MAGGSALDEVYLTLIQFLNVSSVRPYLKQRKLLTDEELEQLHCCPTQQTAVEALIKIVKRKGPNHEKDFLSTLKDSMAVDPHQGHNSVISALEEVLKKRELTKVMEYPEFDDDLERDIVKRESGTHEALERESRRKAALRSKLVKENNEIKMKFTKLVLDVYRLLSRMKVAVDEIRLGLLYLGCFKDNGERGDGMINFGQLSYAETLHSLIACLHNYSSWYNYGTIKFVAEEFGKEEGIKIVADYVEGLTSYCERIIACECPEYSLATGLPPGYDQLIVKVDWDHLSSTAQDVAIFQAELSSLLNLKPEVFILKSVENGCIKITWAVPQSIITYTLMKAMKHYQDLTKLQVLQIVAAGKCIEFKKHQSSPQPVYYQHTLPRNLSVTSESTISEATVSTGYIATDMTPDEIEIVSIYTGSQNGSSFSIESRAVPFQNEFAKARLFYSEADILSQDPPQKISVRRSSLPPEDGATAKPSSKRSVKNFFQSIFPRFYQARSKEKAVTEDADDQRPSFPILDLSQEPVSSNAGKCAYYYYRDRTNTTDTPLEDSVLCTGVEPEHTDHNTTAITTQLEEDETNSGAIASVESSEPGSTAATSLSCASFDPEPTATAAEQPYTGAASAHCSSSDLESGFFSVTNNNSTDSIYHHCTKLVQRSQSMKTQCTVPNSGFRRHERSFQMRLPNNTHSLHSCERSDSPSSGYCDSQSGCSSLYSLSSSLNCNMPLTEDLSDCHYGQHSMHKRNSISSTGRVAHKSTRSHSFTGRFTIQHTTPHDN